jgi:hypothetical protein
MFVDPQFKCSKVGEDSADDIMIVGFEYLNIKKLAVRSWQAGQKK